MKKRVKLLGHIIHANEEDPLKIVSMENGRPLLPAKRRIGLPRQDWFEQNAWKEVLRKDEPVVEWRKTQTRMQTESSPR